MIWARLFNICLFMCQKIKNVGARRTNDYVKIEIRCKLVYESEKKGKKLFSYQSNCFYRDGVNARDSCEFEERDEVLFFFLFSRI